MAQYVKTVWVNGQAPARNATNLNKQEQGIYDNSTHAESTHAPSNADNTAANQTSHDDVVVDGDFTSEGVVYRGATAGLYSIKVIGTDIQAYNAGLAWLAGLTFTNEATFKAGVNLEIGTDVQAYDADTAKTDVAQSFTAAQRATFITAEDNSIAFNTGNNHSFTATAANITVTNQTAGQSGTLVIASSNLITGWGTEFDWGNQGVPTDLTGTEIFAYTVSGASGADSIKIGRV